jgi:hypothetical protein
METLKAMFPDIDEDFLQEVLSSTQNDVERAVDWLLSGGMSSLPKNPVQDKPDGIPDDEPGKPAAPPKAKFEVRGDLQVTASEPASWQVSQPESIILQIALLSLPIGYITAWDNES